MACCFSRAMFIFYFLTVNHSFSLSSQLLYIWSTSSLGDASSIYVFDLIHLLDMCTRMQLDSRFPCKIDSFESLRNRLMCSYATKGYATIRYFTFFFCHKNL